jgi:hypothetical protein
MKATRKRLDGRAIKVIGLGGIGSPVAQGLAQFLTYEACVTTLYLIDGDDFEDKNRARVLYRLPGNKAVSKAKELSEICQGALPIIPVPKYVTPRNVHRLVEERDCILLAVDNHATRRCVSNRCLKLKDVVLISGGNDGTEENKRGTFGNVIAHIREDGRNITSPITRFHPEIANPRDKRPDELSCADLAQSSPQLLFTNAAVASAMLGAFYAWSKGHLAYEEVFLDIVDARMNPLKRNADERR